MFREVLNFGRDLHGDEFSLTKLWVKYGKGRRNEPFVRQLKLGPIDCSLRKEKDGRLSNRIYTKTTRNDVSSCGYHLKWSRLVACWMGLST